MHTVREMIDKSNTHPDDRKHDYQQHLETTKEVNKLRDYLDLDPDISEQYAAIKQLKTANCEEYATATAYELSKLDPSLLILIKEHKEKNEDTTIAVVSDHVWVEVNNAFLVDTWTGFCVPLEWRQKYLKDYYRHEYFSSKYPYSLPVVTDVNYRTTTDIARSGYIPTGEGGLLTFGMFVTQAKAPPVNEMKYIADGSVAISKSNAI